MKTYITERHIRLAQSYHDNMKTEELFQFINNPFLLEEELSRLNTATNHNMRFEELRIILCCAAALRINDNVQEMPELEKK